MTLILDGLSPTGAWSMYRDLLTSFIGGTRYTTATGVNSLNDQSGNARHLVQATAANQPTVATAGPNNRTCADFDGTNDYLATAAALSAFISGQTGYVVASFIADTVGTNSATTYLNDPVFADLAGFMGMYLKTDGTINAGTYTGVDLKVSATISTGTPYVVEWRHEGNVLYLRVNGGAETSVGAGSTSNLTNVFALARAGGGALSDIKVFELATWTTVPALAPATPSSPTSWGRSDAGRPRQGLERRGLGAETC